MEQGSRIKVEAMIKPLGDAGQQDGKELKALQARCPEFGAQHHMVP